MLACEKWKGTTPSLASPLRYRHPVMSSLIGRAGYELRTVKTNQAGGVNRLPELLGQMRGLYLVEFFWQHNGASDHHVIAGLKLLLLDAPPRNQPANAYIDAHLLPFCCAVNCDRRLVFCNAIGVVPFSNGAHAESEETHKAAAGWWHIVSLARVWLVVLSETGVRNLKSDGHKDGKRRCGSRL